MLPLPVFAVFAVFTALIFPVVNADALAQVYGPTAQRILTAGLNHAGSWKLLEGLCRQFPRRLSGTQVLEDAIDWMEKELSLPGVQVQKLPVEVRKWVRGAESLSLLEPETVPLVMLGLGNSYGTLVGGISAPVLSVKSFDDLKKQANSVAGKVVLFNVPYAGYGQTVEYRFRGASEAAKLGAVAALIRSVATGNPAIAHTGGLFYEQGVTKIPAAAISHEAADRIQAWLDKKQTVVVKLAMEAHFEAPALSHNLIAQIQGSEQPEKVVLIGGHIDAWDVGEGAHDDGSGVAATAQALKLLAEAIRDGTLKPPRRTVRLVLFTNEENGLAGAKAYAAWLGKASADHVAVLEMDHGAEAPRGFGLTLPQGADPSAYGTAREILSLLKSVGADSLAGEGEGADIGPLMEQGIPGFSVETVGTHYFDWHHSVEDVLENVNPLDLRKHSAAIAVLAYVLADMPGTLGPAQTLGKVATPKIYTPHG